MKKKVMRRGRRAVISVQRRKIIRSQKVQRKLENCQMGIKRQGRCERGLRAQEKIKAEVDKSSQGNFNRWQKTATKNVWTKKLSRVEKGSKRLKTKQDFRSKFNPKKIIKGFKTKTSYKT
jgi:hypothetical protein